MVLKFKGSRRSSSRILDFDRDSIFQQEDGALFTLIQYI